MANNNDVKQIYKIKEKLISLRTESKGNFCNICFEQDCEEHNQGFSNREDAVRSLTWWLDVACRESDNVLVLGENNEIIVPLFPKGNGTRLDYTYEHIPVLKDLMFLYIAEGVSLAFDRSGNPIQFPDVEISTSGIYWGYVWLNKFYLVSTFANGEFYNSRQGLLSAKEIPLEAPVIGLYHIPKGRLTYDEMTKGLVKS